METGEMFQQAMGPDIGPAYRRIWRPRLLLF